MAKRNGYSDGWHNVGDNFSFYVEDGRLKRAVGSSGTTLYPYKWDRKYQCWNNVSGCPATYYNVRTVEWF